MMFKTYNINFKYKTRYFGVGWSDWVDCSIAVKFIFSPDDIKTMKAARKYVETVEPNCEKFKIMIGENNYAI